MGRKALVIGINHYQNAPSLNGCVQDAKAISNILKRNEDGSKNFSCKELLAEKEFISASEIRDSIRKLFETKSKIALLYFAGHGHITNSGGYICPSDFNKDNIGIHLSDIMNIVCQSKADNKIIILDSCFSGSIAESNQNTNFSEIKVGTTILTACRSEEVSKEKPYNGVPHGIFTRLLLHALEGGASDLRGNITPGGIYALIDQSLGEWDQRPIFKTNVEKFISLRKAKPPISEEHLRKIPEFFSSPDVSFSLDPSFEPERSEEQKKDDSILPPNLENTKTFSILQKYNRVNLLIPVGASQPHMWHAAMESKSCKLTELGKHYWRLAKEDRF